MKKKTIAPFRNEKAERDAALEAAVNTMRGLPTNALLQAMENILKVLKERGQEVRDFDHKEKVVQQVRMVGMKPYMLAAVLEEDVEEYLSELQQAKESNRFLCKRIKTLQEEVESLRAELKRKKG